MQTETRKKGKFVKIPHWSMNERVYTFSAWLKLGHAFEYN